MVHLVRLLCNAYPRRGLLPPEAVRTGVHPQFPQGYPQFCSPSAPENRHASHIIHNFHRLSTSILHSRGPCGKAVRHVRRCHPAACLFLDIHPRVVCLCIFMNSVTASHCPRRCEKRTDFASPSKKTPRPSPHVHMTIIFRGYTEASP